MAASVSLGFSLTDNLSLGATGKYIMISLAGYDATAAAADFGLKYRVGGVSLGLAVANLGQNLKFNQEEDKLPTVVRGGLAFYPLASALVVAIEAEKFLDGDLAVKNGLEYRYDRYFVRGGYSYYPDRDTDKLGQGFSFGVGAVLGRAQLDYTYSPDNRISTENIHKFSVMFSFGH